MKSSLIALFTLFAFIASSAKAEFVVDVNGDPVINGGTYYILPYIWALGGGVGLAKTGNETCPLTVVQSRAEVDNGLPWRISSPLRILYLPTNARLDFFSVQGKVPNCVPSPSSWTIVEKEDGVKSVKINIGRSSRGLCLVITNDIPLGVVFVKAESSEVSKQVINNVLEA
ncbi:hypothetical protein QN277_022967 [Acacia crassicarpa]|uniref:Uncharacterized protein n=1 Tax=Acacia crassicarpa TaxID=499986 RepID=A0AAE1JJ19_9FABA|nr:hypothetical protein QN277_022967 [Acacia crassicarpa]